MSNKTEILCELNSEPVNATPVPGTESLHAIPNKCTSCSAVRMPRGERAFEVNQSKVFICKPVEGLYLDERLAIAVVFNYPEEVIKELIEQVHNNEVRRSITMFSDYFEPPTITHLRQTGVYPYPKEKGEESVEEALRRFEEDL